MGIFGSGKNRDSSSSLAQELPRIVAFGQAQLDARSVDPAAYGLLEADLYQRATSDPEGFTRELADLVLTAGGLATYGGARLAGSLLGWGYQGRYYLSMLDAALDWRHDMGASAAELAPYQLQRWEQVHGFGSW